MRWTILSVVLTYAVLFAGCSEEEKRLSTSSTEALAAYREGVHFMDVFYLTEARSAFEKAIVFDSTFALAWTRLAIVESRSQNQPAAEEHIAHAIELSRNVTHHEQLFVRMWEHRIRYANEQAAAIADSLIQQYPDDPEPHAFRGQLFELEHDLEAAVRLYRVAASLDSTYAPAAMTLGYAYSALNEQDKALGYMERYIRLVPGAADPRASYADLLLRVGRYEEALKQYNQSLQIKPDYWYSITRVGLIYRIFGKLNAAKSKYDEGFKFMPPSAQLDATRIAAGAELDMQRGRYRDAVALYRQALSQDSTNLDASYGMVFALVKLKEFDTAETMLERIQVELARRNLKESEAMQGFHLVRSRMLADQGRLEEARNACEQALEFSSPSSRPSVYRQLAEVLIKQGAVEEALDACEEALSVNANSPDALLTLTRAYHARRDVGMTREIGNRLLEFWKDADADFVSVKELHTLLGLPS